MDRSRYTDFLSWIETFPFVPRWRWTDLSWKQFSVKLSQSGLPHARDRYGNVLLGEESAGAWFSRLEARRSYGLDDLIQRNLRAVSSHDQFHPDRVDFNLLDSLDGAHARLYYFAASHSSHSPERQSLPGKGLSADGGGQDGLHEGALVHLGDPEMADGARATCEYGPLRTSENEVLLSFSEASGRRRKGGMMVLEDQKGNGASGGKNPWRRSAARG